MISLSLNVFNGNNNTELRIFFKDQLLLAGELQRPVSVHCVQAMGPLLKCLKEIIFTIEDEKALHVGHSDGSKYEALAPLEHGNFLWSHESQNLTPSSNLIMLNYSYEISSCYWAA
jgi:Tat protein secretion system quality control protein TatD with DNase activity